MYINNIVMDIVKALLIVGRYCRFIFFVIFPSHPHQSPQKSLFIVLLRCER